MSPAILIGIQLALSLLEGATNITAAVTKMNAAIRLSRSEGRQITLGELSEIARGNRDLTKEVLILLGD